MTTILPCTHEQTLRMVLNALIRLMHVTQRSAKNFVDILIDIPTNLVEFAQNVMKKPLYYVYRHGPDRLGLWNGASDPYICEHLTRGVEYTHWIKHSQECTDLISQNFEAFVCSIIVTLSIMVCLHWYIMITKGLMFYCQHRMLYYIDHHRPKNAE